MMMVMMTERMGQQEQEESGTDDENDLEDEGDDEEEQEAHEEGDLEEAPAPATPKPKPAYRSLLSKGPLMCVKRICVSTAMLLLIVCVMTCYNTI